MRAGALKYRLELLRRVVSRSKTNSTLESFVSEGVIHAERVKLSGRFTTEGGEVFPDYHVEFNIRDAHTVEEGWHVRQLGGNEYVITNIIPNRDRGMLTLVCERFNP